MLRILFASISLVLTTVLLAQPFGNSINLNGSTDFIEIPNASSLSVTNNLVLEAWINPCTINGNQMVFSKVNCNGNQNAYYFTIFNGKLRWVWFNNNCGIPGNLFQSDNIVVTPGVWQHVAVKHTNNAVVLFLNGQPVQASLLQGSFGNLKIVSEPISVGAYKPLSGNMTLFFEGQMDEIRIWDTNISDSQILNLFNNTLSGNELNLIGYYPLDQSTIGPNHSIPNYSNSSSSIGNALTKSTTANTGPFFQSGNHAFLLGNDSTLCDSTSVNLNVSTANYNILWNNTTNSNTFIASAPSTTHLQLSNSCNTLYDTLILTLDSIPHVTVSSDTTFCFLDTINIWGTSTTGNPTWNTGETSDSILITLPDTYFYFATNICGIDSDFIVVELDTNQLVTLGSDTNICTADSILISVSGIFDSIFWSTNDTSTIITAYANNTYWVSSINSCGNSSDTIHIGSITEPNIYLGNDTTLCIGDSLNADVNNASLIHWNSNDSTMSILPLTSGIYTLTGTNECYSQSDSVYVTVNHPPIFSLGPDTIITSQSSLILSPDIPLVNLLWSDSSSLPYLEVLSDGNYFLTASKDGCEFTDSINVEFNLKLPTLFIPNVFSPNKDGLNDLFTLKNIEQISALSVKIFDRWGILIFESNSPHFAWDGYSLSGRALPSGEYFYILNYANLRGERIIHRGTVSLIK